ncbi:MAG: DUF6531 domain-containing protein, partial [Bacteriovorax sp.]
MIFFISIKTLAQSDANTCYSVSAPSVGGIYQTLDEAKSFLEKACAISEVPYYCKGPDAPICYPAGETWKEVDFIGTKFYFLYYFFSNGTEFGGGYDECGQIMLVKGLNCPSPSSPITPSPSDTILDNLNIADNGLTVTLNNGDPVAVDGTPLNTSCDSQACAGDPVNISTGFMWHQVTDFKLNGKTPSTDLYFQRTYVAHPILSNKALGPHWFHNFQTNISPYRINGKNNLIWIDEKGGFYVFLKNEDGTYKNPSGFFGLLVEYADRYELTKSNKVKLIFTKDKSIAPVGSLISINEPHGEHINLSYSIDGLLTTVETGLAGKILFSYDSENLLTRVSRERDNLSYFYTYDSKRNLLSETDFSGYATNYAYQSSSVSHLDGLLLSITDAIGRKTSFQYDEKGRVLTESEPGNATRHFSYEVDSTGVHSTQLQEIDGSIINFVFDNKYRLIKTTHADGSVVKKTWNDQNLVDSNTDALGFVTKYQYDSQGNLISIQKPLDISPTLISYDLNFNKPSQIVAPLSSPINFNIDPTTGDVLEVSRDNLSLKYSYDQLGNILSTNNGLSTYSDQFNSNGLKTSQFDARNPQTLSYDTFGRIATRVFKNGRTISYKYDKYDRIIRTNDSNGPSIINTFDIVGRIISKEIVGSSHRELTKYAWDMRDRLVQTTDNLGRITKYQYDNGQQIIDKPTAIISADGKKTQYKYDSLQRITKIIDAKNFQTKFGYNPRGDATEITDAKGNSTKFLYDGNRRIIKQNNPTVVTNAQGISSPAQEVTTFAYDDRGRMIKKVQTLSSGMGKKAVTLFIYNSLDQVIKKINRKINQDNSIASEDISTFTYEPILDATLIKTANNSLEKLNFNHETLPPFKSVGFSIKATNTKNNLGLLEGSFIITRDFLGEIAALKSTNGATLLSSQFDSAGRLTKTSSGNFFGNKGEKFESAITYDDLGRKISVSNSDGFKQQIAYDQLSRISSIVWNKSKSYDHQKYPDNNYNISEKLIYDLAGNIVNSKREHANTVYGYDELNQLTSENSKYQSSYFLYDLTGNRVKSSNNGVATYVGNAITKDKNSIYAY